MNYTPFTKANIGRVERKEGMYWIQSTSRKRIIYVGISYEGEDIRSRLLTHWNGSDNNKKLAEYPREDLEFKYLYAGPNLLQAPQAELFQIRTLQPECNRVGKNRDFPQSISALVDIVQRPSRAPQSSPNSSWLPFNEHNVAGVERREGIYWIRCKKLNGRIIYIGRSLGGEDVRARLRSHLNKTTNHPVAGRHKPTDIGYYPRATLEFSCQYAGAGSALQPAQAEVFQIQTLKPICNKVGRDKDIFDSLGSLLKWIQT